MKTKSIRNIFALAFILLTVIGCGRYEDGPCISFRSPEKRLCGPKWRVVSFMKNDSDLTAQWTANYDWRLFFHEHYDSGLGESTGIDVFEGNIKIATGGWCFDSNDPDGVSADITKVLFGFSFINDLYLIDGKYPLLTREICEYKILRLKSDELWLAHTDSVQNEYIIKFKDN